MIYTCTLNPSIDYVLTVDSLVPGDLNRGHSPHYFAGGKGINVSRVLKQLDTPSTALGFVGGFTGDHITQALHQQGILTDFISIEGVTRINMKVKSGNETEINGPGPIITPKEQAQFFDKVKQLTKEDTLVLAGSLPSDVPDDFYKQIVNTIRHNDVNIVLDTSSEALKEMMGEKLFLVKPNHHELGELFGEEVHTKEDAILQAKKLQASGIKHVLVSMGGMGAIYVGDAYILTADVPKGEVKNTVGAGDSSVAGFLSALADNQDVISAFRHAVASGSATAFKSDLATYEDIKALLPSIEVNVQKIN